MPDCSKCLNSRPICSENGTHSACCLSEKKARDCIFSGKYYVMHPKWEPKENHNDG